MEWLCLVAVFVAGSFGMLATALMVQGRRTDDYLEGFGHGFQAGKQRARIEMEAEK
ncbi:MAG: hypothetical protein ABIH46_04780 [Chloroflexota bacterium]